MGNRKVRTLAALKASSDFWRVKFFCFSSTETVIFTESLGVLLCDCKPPLLLEHERPNPIPIPVIEEKEEEEEAIFSVSVCAFVELVYRR